jgi:hypothetical protein
MHIYIYIYIYIYIAHTKPCINASNLKKLHVFLPPNRNCVVNFASRFIIVICLTLHIWRKQGLCQQQACNASVFMLFSQFIILDQYCWRDKVSYRPHQSVAARQQYFWYWNGKYLSPLAMQAGATRRLLLSEWQPSATLSVVTFQFKLQEHFYCIKVNLKSSSSVNSEGV